MPLYELKTNAENRINLDPVALKGAVTGVGETAKRILEAVGSQPAPVVLIDGWYGVDWASVQEMLRAAARGAGSSIRFISSSRFFRSESEINAYAEPFMTDDPSFGQVNDKGSLKDIIDDEKLGSVVSEVSDFKSSGADGSVLCIIGYGACQPELRPLAGSVVYTDYTMQPMLWKMWGGELVPFGRDDSDPGYFWKRYYYNDFYLLLKQKKVVFEEMDFYVDFVDAENPKLLDRDLYNLMIDELVKRPFKQVKITQPGPWGAYRYKDLWDVPGLECNAWNELAGIELSVLIDIGIGELVNIPAQNFMQRADQVVGKWVNQTYPGLMPLQVWLDDGYFPEPVPYERSSMPIHNHPDSAYVKRNFNEPLGRYETYYIVEAYRNASTWMGFQEDADLEEWERLIRESNNLKEIPDWQSYIKRWDTNTGDLFLIPPGTSHGHGGNQMILEMDTGPSVAGTEYSFFSFDFARNTWDDDTKTMTAPPMKMHLDHAIANNRWRREEFVRNHHRARPVVVDGNGKTRKDQYTTMPEMPFHIERLFFEDEMVNDTEGRFMHIATLVEGTSVVIQSNENPEFSTSIDRLQSAVVPAGIGKHTYINNDGRHALVVIIRLKKG